MKNSWKKDKYDAAEQDKNAQYPPPPVKNPGYTNDQPTAQPYHGWTMVLLGMFNHMFIW